MKTTLLNIRESLTAPASSWFMPTRLWDTTRGSAPLSTASSIAQFPKLSKLMSRMDEQIKSSMLTFHISTKLTSKNFKKCHLILKKSVKIKEAEGILWWTRRYLKTHSQKVWWILTRSTTRWSKIKRSISVTVKVAWSYTIITMNILKRLKIQTKYKMLSLINQLKSQIDTRARWRCL